MDPNIMCFCQSKWLKQARNKQTVLTKLQIVMNCESCFPTVSCHQPVIYVFRRNINKSGYNVNKFCIGSHCHINQVLTTVVIYCLCPQTRSGKDSHKRWSLLYPLPSARQPETPSVLQIRLVRFSNIFKLQKRIHQCPVFKCYHNETR